MESTLPFEVPNSLVSRRSSSFKNMELTFPDRDIAVFEPTKATRVVYISFLVAGIVDFVMAIWVGHSLSTSVFENKYLPIIVPTAMVIGGGVLIFIAIAGLKGKFGTQKIIFDRRQKVIIKEARKVDPIFEGGLQLKDVAAIQICSGKIKDGDESFKAFELNLVLNRPAGQRISLINHSKGKSLQEDARQLAEFLKLPLLDHCSKK